MVVALSPLVRSTRLGVTRSPNGSRATYTIGGRGPRRFDATVSLTVCVARLADTSAPADGRLPGSRPFWLSAWVYGIRPLPIRRRSLHMHNHVHVCDA